MDNERTSKKVGSVASQYAKITARDLENRVWADSDKLAKEIRSMATSLLTQRPDRKRSK